MKFETTKTKKVNYKIMQGINGSGLADFSIYWLDSKRYEGSVTIEGPFRNESEALAIANCTTKCGERTY